MSKLIDVLSPTGLRTGEILSRAEIHRLGKPHRAIHLYLFNSKTELLLQRRSMTVDHAPGMLSISVLGHLDAGETSAVNVRREVREELGLDSSALQIDFLFSHYQEAVLNETYIDRQFMDVYVAWTDIEISTLRFDPAEVSELKYVPFSDFQAMVSDASSALAPVYANECRDLVYFLSNHRTQ